MNRQQSPEMKYDLEHYDIFSMLYTQEGASLAILRGKTAEPVSWCLVKEGSSVFFPNYHALMDFCRNHHYSAKNSSTKLQPIHHSYQTH